MGAVNGIDILSRTAGWREKEKLSVLAERNQTC